MSIFAARDKAEEAKKKADASLKAARVCDMAGALRLKGEAEALLKQAEALEKVQSFTQAKGTDLSKQFDALDNYTKLFFGAVVALARVDMHLRACAEIDKAACIAAEAVKAAEACDEERARRLREIAKEMISFCRGKFRALAPGDRPRRTIGKAEELLKKADALLKDCPRKRPTAPFMEGGSFDGTKAGLAGKENTEALDQFNRIEWIFKPSGEVPCESLCLVQIFHGENPQKCNEVFDGPSDAFGAPGLLSGLTRPSDADAKDGYVIDTPVGNEHPGYPAQCLKVFRVGGRNVVSISGVDEPFGAVAPFEVYYETAILCVDRTPPVVLQTMRWVQFVDEKGIQRTRILLREGKIDWGRPSGPFHHALAFWLEQRTGGKVRRLPKPGDVKTCP